MITGLQGVRELVANKKKPRGLGLGLQPLRGRVEAGPWWRQEAE